MPSAHPVPTKDKEIRNLTGQKEQIQVAFDGVTKALQAKDTNPETEKVMTGIKEDNERLTQELAESKESVKTLESEKQVLEDLVDEYEEEDAEKEEAIPGAPVDTHNGPSTPVVQTNSEEKDSDKNTPQ